MIAGGISPAQRGRRYVGGKSRSFLMPPSAPRWRLFLVPNLALVPEPHLR